ncbi:uncharacterized protein LOC132312077 [Cornus florida]|uniref:uncharacterized protein LOC132312077 n=1 Tax=Cornus florida TaxID=4283 RepID=UPI00289967F5|nr:uncharacterized protein LOC132312077 [Cornus florida]
MDKKGPIPWLQMFLNARVVHFKKKSDSLRGMVLLLLGRLRRLLKLHFGVAWEGVTIAWRRCLHRTPYALLQSGLQPHRSRSKEQIHIRLCTFSSETCTLHMKS